MPDDPVARVLAENRGEGLPFPEGNRRGRQRIMKPPDDRKAAGLREKGGVALDGAGAEKVGIVGVYRHLQRGKFADQVGQRADMVKMPVRQRDECRNGPPFGQMCYNYIGVPAGIDDNASSSGGGRRFREGNDPGIHRKGASHEPSDIHAGNYTAKGPFMIGRIALICAVALVMYVVVPEIARAFGQWRDARLLALLKKKRGIPGICTGFTDGKLVVQADPVRAAKNAGQAEYAIVPAKTRFALLRKTGELEWLSWRTVRTIRKGTTVSIVEADGKGRSFCVFHEEITERDLEERLAALTAQDIPERTPSQPYAVALGAFIEFFLFFDSLRYPEMSAISVLALVAIFGKALPYCPPGLVLTMLAHSLARGADGQKKSRGHRASGFLLLATGVALNIAVIFFVIRQIGFRFP